MHHCNDISYPRQLICNVHIIAEWAVKLTEMGQGKHHIGDFLPPEELEKFMETFNVCRITIIE